AYTGDISLPMNNAIAAMSGPDPYRESPVNGIKRDVQAIIHRFFGLSDPHPTLRTAIGIADRKMLNIDRWLSEGVRARSMPDIEAQGQFLRTLEALLSPNGAAFVGQYDDVPGSELDHPMKDIKPVWESKIGCDA
ncbi:hypothetical protein LCGC14_3096980, partial [marine sediment metagenome]